MNEDVGVEDIEKLLEVTFATAESLEGYAYILVTRAPADDTVKIVTNLKTEHLGEALRIIARMYLTQRDKAH